MTTKLLTGILSKPVESSSQARLTLTERAFQIGFGAIQWPWLLKSLYGGTRHSKFALLERLGLDPDALPHLGSWKADTHFLHRVIDLIEERQPANVVELGSGATSLIIASALKKNRKGELHSYDQHLPFVGEMAKWLSDYDLDAAFHHAPLFYRSDRWPGLWYALSQLPDEIDLLVIDGPPWSVHPFARGIADCLFDRISPGGIIMLDDAARPGERLIARRWRSEWPEFSFNFEGEGSKGLLIGRKSFERV
ncbi:MAG: class I SAM-dependent methyltransferase [Gammaproteobacteria bacterium]|nr:class I SAM-dependent methyltransferase [Gammaproteobacteria bacterium]